MQPKGSVQFSIVIPTLNEEHSLPLCLESLRKQQRNDFEVLIIDGGSIDATTEVANRFGLKTILVKKRRPHDVSSARNEGIRRSRGSYIFFLDADMVIDPNCLNILEEEFNNCEIIGVCLRVQPYNGHLFERSMYEFNNALCWLSTKTRIYQLSYFSSHCYRKEYVKAVGGFREDLNSCEDMDMSLRISRMGKYAFSFRSTLWASPRRVRQWSYSIYVLKYLKFLLQYYILSKVDDFYEDLGEHVSSIVDEKRVSQEF